MLNIIEGHINELLGLNDDISKKRLLICRQCPLYKRTYFGPICNSKLYYNPTTNELSETPKEGFIQGCGCRLEAKTTLINEKCIIGKW